MNSVLGNAKQLSELSGLVRGKCEYEVGTLGHAGLGLGPLRRLRHEARSLFDGGQRMEASNVGNLEHTGDGITDAT